MKKTFSILSMILLGCALYAGPVTPEKALQVAQSVFASAPGTKAAGESELKIVWDGEFEPATKAAQDPAFYVVSRPEGGFVMVAGNDNVQPVLAFSFENDFVVEGMPDNVRWWMQQYKDHVRSSVSATPAIREQWEKYESTKAEADPVSPVTNEFNGSRTNLWNQTNPANFFCPDVDPEHQSQTSVCGCVALATAEVMAWFGSQNMALTSYEIPSYSYSTDKEKTDITILPHSLYTSYTSEIWTALKGLNTPDSFYGTINGYSAASAENRYKYLYYGANRNRPNDGDNKNSLTELGENLAYLTYDIGTLVEANYNEGNSSAGHSGTGAPAAYIVSKVAPAFKYNNGARYVRKQNYTNSQWQQMLKDEITLRPVIYTGEGAPGGHAYVADGYATYNGGYVFHFNLGWAGGCNGYYTLDIQDDFTVNHDAILDFYPSTSYAASPYIKFSSGGSIVYVSGYCSPTLSFTLTNFYNEGTTAFSGDIYAGRENYSGVLAEVQKLFETNMIYNQGYSSYSNLSATFSDAVFGDQLVAYYKEDGKATYLPFRYEPLVAGTTAIPFFPAAAIKKKSSYVVGDLFVFELTNHTYDYSSSAWTVTTPGGVTTNYSMTSDAVLLSEVGDYKITCTTDEETVVTYITVNAAP